MQMIMQTIAAPQTIFTATGLRTVYLLGVMATGLAVVAALIA